MPEVSLDRPANRGKSSIVLDWKAHDKERSRLSYDVVVSVNGGDWGPIAYGLTQSKFVVDTATLAPGEYRVEVLALNSIRVGRSNQVTFQVERDHQPPGGKPWT